MIAREVMANVWCQYLQHLLIVMILDMGEGLSREFLDELAVDHRFFPPQKKETGGERHSHHARGVAPGLSSNLR